MSKKKKKKIKCHSQQNLLDFQMRDNVRKFLKSSYCLSLGH